MTCNLLESCEIFNSLFGKITTIQSNHNHIKSVNPVHEINSSTLTSDQKHAIKQLAGVLMDMSVIIPSMSKTSSIDSSDNIEKVAELDQHTVNHNLLERKQKRTISALQDYLYQELTRCEELESKLQAKEMELVNVVVERDKYLKKCQQENLISSQSHSRAISSSLNQSATSAKANFDELDTFTPQEWIGRYIRKGFGSSYYFGIVVSYDAPYFKVSTSPFQSIC